MNLRQFLERMEDNGEVLHIGDPVSPKFEIAHIIKHFEREGPILLFENVDGFQNKVVANVCGTRKRICEALDVSQNHLYSKLSEAWRFPQKPEIDDAESFDGICEKPNLYKIPVLTHFEKDAGPYITAAIIHAKDLSGEHENVSVHRLQILDEKHLAIRLVPRHLYKIWREAKAAGKDLDVAIAIGVHPAVVLAASTSPPFGVNEFEIANALLNNRLRLIRCKYVDAYAPADAELILEGKISATKEVPEGPFVDITGTYDVVRKQPVVEIVNVMRKEDYLYQALLPSGAEHRLLMGLPREASIYEAVSKVVPRVHAVNLSVGGSGWLHAIISIDKQLEGDAKNALLAAFAAHPSLKHAIVVDSDVDVYDPFEVEWAIATRFQASEDLIVIENVRGSTLDSSANQETGTTSKMGLDATVPLDKPREKFEKAKIPKTVNSQRLIDKLQGIRRQP
ncbi:UbiD family decarboxylase [Candidatus Bathyarchaeota archaeon]|nr:UbiD family decarboxylase [Candidatus Bathyarchaeota archaeon]